jgi:diguanylate cyclase (GGDEF)-like protein
MKTRLERRRGLTALGSGGASVLAAAVLVGLSVGATCWAAESALLDSMRSGRADDVRAGLLAARNLIADKERSASREASALAGRSDLQSALVGKDVAVLTAWSRTHPRVGFSLANGQLVGGAALAGPGATIAVYSHGRYVGRVVVATPPDASLLSEARKSSPHTHLLYVVDGNVVASSPDVGHGVVTAIPHRDINDQVALPSLGRTVSQLYAYRAEPGIPLRRLWPFAAALIAAAVSFRVFERRELRRRSKPPPNSVRDAVALVGETLAATHNTQALLPVILRAAVEATGASGGTIEAGELSLATRGTIPPDPVDTLRVDLEVSEEQTAVMTLYSSDSGFGADARDAMAWIAEQALIALENARLHGLVQRQAVTDELTGLANRRSFLSRLEAEITRSRRSGSPLGIVLADLDDFKRVNDTYGHEAGDEVLRSFAEIMTTVARDVDLPVRLGGEEFAVLLPDTDIAGATLLAERLRLALESTAIGLSPSEIRLTASFGVSAFPAAAVAEDLLSDADRRLYDAKRSGKNRVVASKETGTARPH